MNKLALHDLPDAPGTYVLLIRLDDPVTLQVGRLGTFDLVNSLYAYVGSARGPGGLRARVTRHLRPDKTPHWHIDSLTALAPVDAVWWDASTTRLECGWARLLATLPLVTTPVPRFGSSDCACPAHLFAFPQRALRTVWDAMARPNTSPHWLFANKKA